MSQPIDYASILAAAVHDMKNSLALLTNSIESLAYQSAGHNDAQAAELARLHYEASRINAGLVQLLALYRERENQLPVVIDEGDISELLDEVVANHQLYIDNQQLDVVIDCPRPLLWYFDANLLGFLLNDVLINALRYSKQRLLFRAHIDGQNLRIELHDDGQGFPAHIIEQVTQGYLSHNDLQSGRTGLGLYFAALIANAHQQHGQQGKITLSNQSLLGGGCFAICLP